jgi:hypothetical protein
MKILRIESLVYGVDDVEAGMRYFDDWGIPSADRGPHGADYRLPSGQTVKLRSAGDPTLPPAVEPGSTLREITWGTEDAASLAAIGAELGKDRALEDAGGRICTRDPWGMTISFCVAQPRPTSFARERSLNHPFDIGSRVQPQRIGHAVFFVPGSKMRETAEFYLDRLGFRLSDRVPQFGDFMRCSGSLDHHNLFLLQKGERAGFHHAAFEVASFDEIIVGGKYMLSRDWKPETTPGRHVMGSNLFWYFESPCGGSTEYFSDMDLMDDGWKPRVWDKHPGFAFWMMDLPLRPAAESQSDSGSRFGAVDRDILGPRVP